MIACFIFGSLEFTNFAIGSRVRILENCNLLEVLLQYSFMISWKDSMKNGFPLFAGWFESKRHCFAILMLDLSDNLSVSLRDIMFVTLLFTLHVPLDRYYWVGYCCWWSLALGELCLLGYPMMTIPVWDKFGHKSGRLFHLSISS